MTQIFLLCVLGVSVSGDNHTRVEYSSLREAEVLMHAMGALLGNHPPTFTLNNNLGIPFLADRAFFEDGGPYFVEQWGCGVSDCNGGGQALTFKFRLISLTRPDPNDPTNPNGVTDTDLNMVFSQGPVGVPRRDGDANIPGMGQGMNILPDPDLCDGLPLIPCYPAGNPSNIDSSYASLIFETFPDRWGIATFEVWIEDDGLTYPINGINCHCQSNTVPCPVGQVITNTPCNEQCNRGLAAAPTTGLACNRQTFTLNILPVNDPPSFVPKGGVIVEEGDGMTTIPDWACQIDHGGWMEWPYQDVNFDITVSDPTFFAVQPAIASVPAGEELPCRDLTFTPADGKCGRVTVTVTPVDSGGLFGGGGGAQMGSSRAGESHTFTIEVRPVNGQPSFTRIGLGSPLTVQEGDRFQRTFPGWATNMLGDPVGSCQVGDRVVGFDIRLDTTSSAAGCLTVFDVPPHIDIQTGDLRFTPHNYANQAAPGCCYEVRAVDTFGLHGEPEELCIIVTPTNDAPTFTGGGDVFVCENTDGTGAPDILWATNICAGKKDTALTCDPLEQSTQTVSFLVSTQSTMFATGPTISSTGVLSYTLQPNVSGTAVVTVVAVDNGDPQNRSLSEQNFQITVLPVNSPPSGVIPQPVVTVNEDAGPQYLSRFVTSISRGPGIEDSTQNIISIGCDSTNRGLFSAPPELVMNGHSLADLRFTSRDNEFGTSTVTCTLSDDGGLGTSQCPGVHTSQLVFTVTVLPVDDPPFMNFTETCLEDTQCSPTTTTCATGTVAGTCTTRTISAQIAIDEDSGVVQFRNLIQAFGGGPPNEDQNVVFQLSAQDPLLLDPSFVPQVDPNNGMITFKTADDAFGKTVLTITITDSGGNSVSYYVNLIVNSVNDNPIAPLADDILFVDACYTAPCPLLSYSQLFSSLSPGPPNENTQVLSFAVGVGSGEEWFETAPYFSQSQTNPVLFFKLKAGYFLPGQHVQDMQLIVKDDGGGGPLRDTTTQTLRVIVVAVNQPPSFAIQVGPVYSVEDTFDVVRIFQFASAITSGTPGEDLALQGMSFECSLANPSLLKFGTALTVDITSGDMMFEVAPDAFGETRGTCRLRDTNGAAVVQTFDFIVQPVNDCPVIRLLPGQVTIWDLGAQQYSIFESLSVGPSNENGQVLTLSALPMNAVKFSPQPNFTVTSLSNFDSLPLISLAPSESAYGLAIIKIGAKDSEDTKRGGCNTAQTQDLQVFIRHANRQPTFVLSPEAITVPEDSEGIFGQNNLHEVESFLRNVYAGHQLEDDQTVFCSVLGIDGRLVNATTRAAFEVVPYLRNAIAFTNAPLYFKGAGNATGVYHFTVVCVDSGSNVPPSNNTSPYYPFSIQLLPVNDPPSFSFGRPNIEIWEDSPSFFRPFFIEDINAGPGEERLAQTIEVSCLIKENPHLFQSGINVVRSTTSNGVGLWSASVSFAPAQNEFGVAVVKCCVTDNGGSLVSGQNYLCKNTTITIRPVNDPPDFSVLTPSHLTEEPEGGDGSISVPRVITRFLSGVTPGNDQEWLLGRVEPPQTTLTPVVTLTDPNGVIVGAVTIVSSHTLPGLLGSAYDMKLNVARGRCGQIDGKIDILDSGGTTEHISDQARMTSKPFTIVVKCINDAPSYRPGKDIVICEDAVAANHLWATEITAGFNEAHQNITFSIEPVDLLCERIFKYRPVLHQNGSVFISPEANRSGQCQYTVSIRDSGDSLSSPVSGNANTVTLLNIKITKVNDPPFFTYGPNPIVINERCEPTCLTCGDCSTELALPNYCRDVTAGGHGGDEDAQQKLEFDIQLRYFDTLDNWRLGEPGATQVAAFNITKFFEKAPEISLPDCTMRFKPRPNIWGNFTFFITLRDDGGREGCITQGSSGINSYGPFPMSIYIEPINDPPVVTLSTDSVTILEDNAQIFSSIVTAITPGTLESPSQTATVWLTTDKPELFAAGSPPELIGGTSLRLTPAPDMNGVARIFFNAQDDGPNNINGPKNLDPNTKDISKNWATVELIVRILPVNDRPSFKPGLVIQAQEDSGRSVAELWAAEMSAGPIDETGQSLSFVVAYDQSVFDQYFTEVPSLDDKGSVSFALQDDAFGDVDIPVKLIDNGRDDFPNENESPLYTLRISIQPVNDPPSFQQDIRRLPVARSIGNVKTAFATMIKAGPDNEAYQTVAFHWNVEDNPVGQNDIFLTPPVLGGDGVIEFFLNPKESGERKIVFHLRDSEGGTSETAEMVIVSEAAEPTRFEVCFDQGATHTAQARRDLIAKGMEVETNRIGMHWGGLSLMYES